MKVFALIGRIMHGFNRVLNAQFRFKISTLNKKYDGIQFQRLAKRLAGQEIRIELGGGARKLLAEKGYDPVYGARPLKRVIQQYIENPLSMEILKGAVKKEGTILVEAENDEIVFR